MGLGDGKRKTAIVSGLSGLQNMNATGSVMISNKFSLRNNLLKFSSTDIDKERIGKKESLQTIVPKKKG